jgi:hypothetical protein
MSIISREARGSLKVVVALAERERTLHVSLMAIKQKGPTGESSQAKG